jgi:hypothetical protein
MFKSLFAAVTIFFASIFGAHSAHVAAPAASQPAVAAIVGTAENNPSTGLPAADPFHTASTSIAATSLEATTTIIKQYITQPVIERVVQAPQGTVLGASSEGDLDAKLAGLKSDILSHLPPAIFVPSFSGPAESTPVSTATFAQSQKVDQLAGVALTDISVNGVSGLTDADIPDSITTSSEV